MFTVDTLKFIATDNKSEKSISDEEEDIIIFPITQG